MCLQQGDECKFELVKHYEPLRLLIESLEQSRCALGMSCSSMPIQDAAILLTRCSEMKSIYDSIISPAFEDFNLDVILTMRHKLDQFGEDLKKYAYLTKLSSENLWNIYHKVIKNSDFSQVEGLTKESKV